MKLKSFLTEFVERIVFELYAEARDKQILLQFTI